MSRFKKPGVWLASLRLATALTGVGACFPVSALAQDRFERQVYDTETAPRGALGLELHVNAGISTADTVTHLTLEPHYGLTDWCELGAYLQAAALSDGTLLAAGAKLRAKLRLPRRVSVFGFALNVEVSDVPTRFEANPWGAELRPAIDAKGRYAYASVNPILGFDLAGPQAGHAQFEPAAKVAAILRGGVWLGVEYYGAWQRDPTHLLFGTLDWSGRLWDLNLGVGHGFAGPEQWVMKAILGVHPPE